MDKCEIERNPISLAVVKLQGDAHLKCCIQMCSSLALITKGSVRTLVRSVEESNGGEAWRLIHNRYAQNTQNRQYALMQKIMMPAKLWCDHSEGFESGLRAWELDVGEWRLIHNRRAPDTQNRQYALVQSYCHLVLIHTQVKREDAPALPKLLKSECPGIWIRLPRHKWSKSWLHTEEPIVLSKEMCTVTRLLDCCGKDMSIKFYWDLGGRTYQTGNACWCIASKVYSCLCTWMTSNWLERSKISIP